MQGLDTVEVKEFRDRFRKRIWWLTPIGKSHNQLLESIGEEPNTEAYLDYKKAFDKYRYTKRAEVSIRILFYAGLISSVAASMGLEQLRILQSIAAYIGITAIIILYAVTSYFNLRAREEFYLRRDLLVKEIG